MKREIWHFEKGFSLEPHYHSGTYEWYVLSGKFKMINPETNDETILQKGDYYYNPPNMPHYEICLEEGKVLWMYSGAEYDFNLINK